MNETFRKVFTGYLVKETKDGPVAISRTITEYEAMAAKVARNSLSVTVKRISPDVAYFMPKVATQSPK